ncbi:MAG: tripartite tricarboxylate transporter substrate binding protein [Variovorax sp.]|nr:MAG: tripartite tricarboxylate transporter substrate binding protein [Variovorax sp.]
MKFTLSTASHASRRHALLAAAALLAVAAVPASADTYPSRSIRMIVPYLAGGVTDVMARQFAQVMGDKLGQQVVIDNKPGANTIIATQAVASSAPDGYTIFFMDLSLLSYNAYLYKQQPYDLARDFVPVTSVAEIPLGLAVNSFVPVNSVNEFVAYAKANPDKLNYASAAAGGLPHLGMENLKAVTGIKMTHVPYKGAAAAITDMVGGQVQAMFNDVSTSVQYVSAGKMKVLAISGEKRMPKMPDVPTFAELGMPALSVAAFMGIVAPAKTPQAILEKLDAAIREASKSPQITEYLQSNNLVPKVTSGKELTGIIGSEEKKWRSLVTKLDLKVD